MKQQYTGHIIKTSSDKTQKVEYQFPHIHKKYKKTILHSKHMLVHDQKNEGKVGDKVLIEYCRPISKKKFFKIKKIISRKEDDNEINKS